MNGLGLGNDRPHASLMGAIKIGHAGTQHHEFTMDEFRDRFRSRSVDRCDPRRLRSIAWAATLAAAVVAPSFGQAETPVWEQDAVPRGAVGRDDRDRPGPCVRHRVEQSSQATGFVVDAENGLILTNRHVVTPARRRDGGVPES